MSEERLREILLAKRTEEEWKRWEGNSKDFESTLFDLEGYRNFTGEALRRIYEERQRKKYLVRDIFSDANIEVGSDPEILRKRIEDRFERLYGILEDPVAVRNLFLQIKSEEEWAKPQQYFPLRKQKVAISDNRSITLHTLCYLFSIYKYNLQQESVDSYIGFDDVIHDSRFNGVVQSNRAALGEILDFAGIEYKFIPDLSDGINLHDPAFLRKILFHATYEDGELLPAGLKKLSAAKFRKVRLCDPTTGFNLTGHSLMLFYSAFHYVKEHPEVGLEEAANTLKKGKSNQAVMDEILAKARF
ncbi:MAG TPA: hypothetical protein VJH65_00240 [Candidatus Nanoarchaeia archaeon]|nr:hypothetical protein [Candidatus Nanoarchaeia archaeon]